MQSVVALSTMEFEYMTVTEEFKESLWLNEYCDNQSAVYLSENQTFHERTKHIDIRFHYFIRDVILALEDCLK